MTTILDRSLAGDFEAGLEVVADNFATVVKYAASGKRFANGLQLMPRRIYRLGRVTQPPTNADIADTIDLLNEARGRAFGFLVKDPLDSVLTDETLQRVPGTTTDYQLSQQFGSIDPLYRKITRPDAGSIVVKRAGVTQTLTTDYTVEALGVIRFLSDPGADAITASCTYKVPVTRLGDRAPVRMSAGLAGMTGLELEEELEF